MNKNFSKLFQIIQKKERIILGLMSGTSLDGLDLALCRIKGQGLDTNLEVLNFDTLSYRSSLVEDLNSVFSKKTIDLEMLCLLHAQLASVQSQMILDTLEAWQVETSQIDCLASHGQTVYHAPTSLHQNYKYPNATFQIGEADHLAHLTNILTISDFRQKHIAAGGEGAPLAVFGDYLLFSSQSEHRVLVNIGGISNLTFLPKNQNIHKVLSTDVGTGNKLMDLVCKVYFEQDYDTNGKLASQGKVNDALLAELLKTPFLDLDIPKTTGAELFNLNFIRKAQEKSQTEAIDPTDLLATLTFFTAQTISDCIRKNIATRGLKVYVSGGGLRNTTLMHFLEDLKLEDWEYKAFEDLGVNPNAKEAVVFAVLANETLVGKGLKLGTKRACTLGKVSLPF